MIKRLLFATAPIAVALLLANVPSMSMATTAASYGALKNVGVAQSTVQKTHGWHRTCRRGLNGYHKHVPGVGRIQCTARKCWRNSWGVRRCRWY